MTETRYRLYTDEDLAKLQEILFFREVDFALKEIKKLLQSHNYNQTEALEKHLVILEAQKEHIDNLSLLLEVKSAENGNFHSQHFLNQK